MSSAAPQPVETAPGSITFTYKTVSGRPEWLSRDPIEDAEMMPDGPNLYSYVQNNPLNLFDPIGMQGVPSMNSVTSNPVIAAELAIIEAGISGMTAAAILEQALPVVLPPQL